MRLPVEVRGSGPAMVLVHGRASNSGTWEPLLPHLEDYQVHLVDTLGHGKAPSPEDPAAYAIENHVRLLEEALAGFDRPFVLVGHSMGGFLALRYTLEHQDRVSALVLEATSADNPFKGGKHQKAADGLRKQMEIAREMGMEALCDFLEKHDELHPRQRRNLMSMTTLAYLETIQAIRDMPDVDERIPELKLPTLVVAGYKDAIFFPECQRLAERIPGARSCFLPEAAHSPHRETPEKMAAAMHDFLGEYLGGSRPSDRARA